jgi:hypothetical protein
VRPWFWSSNKTNKASTDENVLYQNGQHITYNYKPRLSMFTPKTVTSRGPATPSESIPHKTTQGNAMSSSAKTNVLWKN